MWSSLRSWFGLGPATQDHRLVPTSQPTFTNSHRGRGGGKKGAPNGDSDDSTSSSSSGSSDDGSWRDQPPYSYARGGRLPAAAKAGSSSKDGLISTAAAAAPGSPLPVVTAIEPEFDEEEEGTGPNGAAPLTVSNVTAHAMSIARRELESLDRDIAPLDHQLQAVNASLERIKQLHRQAHQEAAQVLLELHDVYLHPEYEPAAPGATTVATTTSSSNSRRHEGGSDSEDDTAPVTYASVVSNRQYLSTNFQALLQSLRDQHRRAEAKAFQLQLRLVRMQSQRGDLVNIIESHEEATALADGGDLGGGYDAGGRRVAADGGGGGNEHRDANRSETKPHIRGSRGRAEVEDAQCQEMVPTSTAVVAIPRTPIKV